MSDLIERLHYTAEHGLFTAVDEGLYASPQECLDHITTLETKLAVAREALEPVRDFLIHEVGFEDDDEPLTAILRALKEIEQ